MCRGADRLKCGGHCKGGIPLLLYEAPISPERWRTSPRHVRKYGYAAQPAWHVRILCRTTSMYIDPGFAQLLAQHYTYHTFIKRESVCSSRGFSPYILAPDMRPTAPRDNDDQDVRPVMRLQEANALVGGHPSIHSFFLYEATTKAGRKPR